MWYSSCSSLFRIVTETVDPSGTVSIRSGPVSVPTNTAMTTGRSEVSTGATTGMSPVPVGENGMSVVPAVAGAGAGVVTGPMVAAVCGAPIVVSTTAGVSMANDDVVTAESSSSSPQAD